MKLIEFSKSHPRVVVGLLLALLVTALLVIGIPMLGSSINEARIGKLETEKQQALKERDEAHARDLILQGKIEAKDEQIKSLTSQIAESTQRVVNAHNETQTARATVQKVRSDPAKFNSSDDAGRINELGSELHGLYPDSP
jgi:peptidoglycan hydrolase CwlO-like protein